MKLIYLTVFLLVDHPIENHGTVALGLVIECTMTRRENVGTEVGVEIKNEEPRGVAESVRAKVEEVEVRNGQRKSEAGAENVAISAAEVKARNTRNKVEVRNESEVAARIEVCPRHYYYVMASVCGSQ